MPTIDLGKVKGDDGRSATIAIGTVTTGLPGTNASVTNSGTDSAAVLDFVIPRGSNGVGIIPDDEVSGKSYVFGVSNAIPYVQDTATGGSTKYLVPLNHKRTWNG